MVRWYGRVKGALVRRNVGKSRVDVFRYATDYRRRVVTVAMDILGDVTGFHEWFVAFEGLEDRLRCVMENYQEMQRILQSYKEM